MSKRDTACLPTRGGEPAGDQQGQKKGAKQRVFLLKEGKAVPVQVVTGISDNSFVEVVEGLKENDAVIVEQVQTAKKSSAMGPPMGPRF